MQYVERVVMRHRGILLGVKCYIKHKARVVISQTKQTICVFPVENFAVFGQNRRFFRQHGWTICITVQRVCKAPCTKDVTRDVILHGTVQYCAAILCRAGNARGYCVSRLSQI